MKTLRIVTCLVFAVNLVACAGPSIGLKTDFQAAKFQVNKTTRAEVINRLGLPQKIMKDSQGREHFIYEGDTHLVSACIGCGDTNTGVGVIPALINESGVRDGAEYVFDTKNILIAKFEPTNK